MAPVAAWCRLAVGSGYRTRTLLVCGLFGAAAAAVFFRLVIPCLAVPALVLAGSVTGIGLGRQFRRPWWLSLAAVGALVADLWSVFAGPTRLVIDEAPAVLGYLLVQTPALGGGGGVGIGVTDVLFLSLFLEGARVCNLRMGWSLTGMCAGLVATIGLVIVTGVALPALPLLATGFLAANVDLLWRDIGHGGRAR